MIRWTTFAALAALAACTTVPVSTLWRLSQVDILTVDAAGLRVAVKAPEALALPRDGAVMTVGARRPDGREIQERFVLAPAPQAEADPDLADHASAGFALRAYRVAPEDLERLDAARADIRAWKAEAGDAVQGSLSIAARACPRGPAPLDGPLPVSTFLRFDAQERWFKLSGPDDIADHIDAAGLTAEPGAPGCPPARPAS
ncbi:MAG: hypothetical protein AAF192_07830 [Pseudomonadota bacterium]